MPGCLIISSMDCTKEKTIKACEDYVRFLLDTDSSGHGYDHIERVVANARKILEKEKADTFVVIMACLLHDVDDYKLFPGHEDLQNAVSFLNGQDIDPGIQENILSCIRTVSFKGKDTKTPDTIEGKVVQDADRLDAIGAIGIARAFAYGGKHDRRLYDRNETYRTDMSFEEYRRNKSSTIAHFHEKLLLLKDMMNTEEGKRLAEERHAYMLSFLEEFAKETGYGR